MLSGRIGNREEVLKREEEKKKVFRPSDQEVCMYVCVCMCVRVYITN